MEMEKPKSDRQIEAEFNLANDPTELNLYTTTKTGTPPSYNTVYESQIEKYVLNDIMLKALYYSIII